MIQYVRGLADVVEMLFDDSVVVVDSVRELVLMCRQVAVHKTYGTPVDVKADAHCPFVALVSFEGLRSL